MHNRDTFGRSEKLKSRKLIGYVFAKGKVRLEYPVRIHYIKHSEETDGDPVQATFVVPKRNFKKAVDRNRIKRQMREAYRLQKAPFLEHFNKEEGQQVALVFAYQAKNKSPYEEIHRAIGVFLSKPL